MGEDYKDWHSQLNLNLQPPNLNSLGRTKLDLGLPLSAYSKPGINMAPMMNGSLPSFEAPNCPGGQASEPHGWFYCLPRFRQGLMPDVSPILNVENHGLLDKSCGETLKHSNLERAQKKFLVVDQSADQTTLIFSSGVGDPVHRLASWTRNSNEPSMVDSGIKKSSKDISIPIIADDFNESDETGMESEMREDTEELDALLYSDDDDDINSTEDDEVTSTGHSPSTMTSFGGDSEEVASSAESTKKRKLFERDHANDNDDAESSCVGEKGLVESRESGGIKRLCKEKIRETVSVLQTIIPDGEGKNAIAILDEAIQYLKSLKVKAQIFGLDAL